jgi:DNA-directed RNA polymerase subunit RPC12/RpoP
MEYDCPNCGEAVDVEVDDLPQTSCENTDYECPHCEHICVIGWYAEIDIRETGMPTKPPTPQGSE